MQNTQNIKAEVGISREKNIDVSSPDAKTVTNEKITTRKLSTAEKRLKKKRMMVYKPKNNETKSIMPFFQLSVKEETSNKPNQIIATDVEKANTSNETSISTDSNNHISKVNESKDPINVNIKQGKFSTCSRKEHPQIKDSTSNSQTSLHKNAPQGDKKGNVSQNDNNDKNTCQNNDNISQDNRNSQDDKDRSVTDENLSSNTKSSESQSSELTSSFHIKEKVTDSCVLCGKDLTKFGIVTREAHLNRCLEGIEIIDVDEKDNKKKSSKGKKAVQLENSGVSAQNFPLLSTITTCPCCHKGFSSRIRGIKGKISHVKKCGNKQGYTVTKMLSLLQEIAQDVASNVAKTRKDAQLTNYFTPERNEEHTAVVSRAYQVSYIEGSDQDADFKSNVMITAVSSIEESGKKRKRKVEEDSDDDFRVAKVLSLSEALERNKERWKNRNKKKRVVYTLETTPILPPSESISKARRRAQHMFFKKRTMESIVKNCSPTSTFGPSRLANHFEFSPIDLSKGENEITTKTQRKSLWKMQALGGSESTLTDDDYVTDMLRNVETSYIVRVLNNVLTFSSLF